MLGVIIVDHGSRRDEANVAFTDLVRRFADRYDHAVVEPAHMELARPSIADAFATAIGRGATELVVHPYFLSPGRHYTEDIPRLCREAAANHAGVEWTMTEPLGASEQILEVIAERIDCAHKVRD